MIYGLYVSAAGVLANSYSVDVIANNLANSETVGFKRDLTAFRQRLTAAQLGAYPGAKTDPMLEKMGGGVAVDPTMVDTSQGSLEPTENPLDLGVDGKGYFAVKDAAGVHLTRDGRFTLNADGELVMNNSRGSKVLDARQQPIRLAIDSPVQIQPDGTIQQNGGTVATLGLFGVADPSKLTKAGFGLLDHPDVAGLPTAQGAIHSGMLEQANVDPTTELAQLMQAQRDLEANANMIRYQDETLQSLVQDVGKIS